MGKGKGLREAHDPPAGRPSRQRGNDKPEEVEVSIGTPALSLRETTANEASYRAQYDAYMTSPAWRRVRERVLTKRGSKCEVCGTNLSIQVHHGTYERFGAELDDDLFILCAVHHQSLHDYHRRTKYTLWKATLRYLARPVVSPSMAPKVTTRVRESNPNQLSPEVQRQLDRVIRASHTPEGWLPRNRRKAP